jgi:dTDP-4-amino-4,6-dideoxygalactose transaminase
MIPRHSLPFGIGMIFSTVASPAQRVTASQIEKAYADALGVPEVIWLPSVRAGIHMTVLAGARPGGIVVGPAYTCDTGGSGK